MPRTSEYPPNPFTALDQLSSALARLLDVTENSRWEQLEALVPVVSAAIEAALNAPLTEREAAAYRSKLTALLAMHKQAIEQCTTRMNDISPMLSAFSGNRNTPAKP